MKREIPQRSTQVVLSGRRRAGGAGELHRCYSELSIVLGSPFLLQKELAGRSISSRCEKGFLRNYSGMLLYNFIWCCPYMKGLITASQIISIK